VQIRDAVEADAEAIARVHVASWQAAYRGMLPDGYLDGLEPGDRRPFWEERLAAPPARSAVLVAEDGGSLVGFTTLLSHPDLGPSWALLPHLYLHPDAWGRGVGPALLDAVLDRARALGFAHVELWVLVDNVRARQVYEREGWVSDGTQKSEEVWGVELPEVRYRLEL
jgi:RimJ/RimL family protein N-acetyltransferase